LNKLDIKFSIFFLIVLLVQLTILKYLQIFNWRPDLLLVLLVSYALLRGPSLGMSAGFIVGLTQDLLSTHLLGLTALAKTLAGFTAGILIGRFSPRTEFFLTLLVSSLVHDLCYFFIYTLGEEFTFQSLIFLYTIPNTLYTLILGGFLHYIVQTWLHE